MNKALMCAVVGGLSVVCGSAQAQQPPPPGALWDVRALEGGVVSAPGIDVLWVTCGIQTPAPNTGTVVEFWVYDPRIQRYKLADSKFIVTDHFGGYSVNFGAFAPPDTDGSWPCRLLLYSPNTGNPDWLKAVTGFDIIPD